MRFVPVAVPVLLLAASGAAAQSSLPPRPYPANDIPLRLSSGTVVRERNFVVFRGRQDNSLAITIETPTAAADTARVASEAREVAVMHEQYVRSHGISRVSVAVCRSRPCLELREVAPETFRFVIPPHGAMTIDTARAPQLGLSNER